MKKLSKLVNVIPVLTAHDDQIHINIDEAKRRAKEALFKNQIEYFDFQDAELALLKLYKQLIG